MAIEKETLKSNYPKAWAAFGDWFEREGWGADNVDDLSQQGIDEWLPDFLRDCEVNSVDEFESGIDES